MVFDRHGVLSGYVGLHPYWSKVRWHENIPSNGMWSL